MSNDSRVTITASCDQIGGTFEFYIGTSGSFWPNSSTFDTGSGQGITLSHTFTTANTPETFTIDFAQLDNGVWTNWSGKSGIAFYGLRAATDGANYTIESIKLGSEADIVTGTNQYSHPSISIFPNPTEGILNVNVSAQSTVELSDVTGKVVATKSSANGEQIVFHTSSIPAGIYIVTIKSIGNIFSQKVIVK